MRTLKAGAGLEDGVDYHWWDIAKAAALDLLGVGKGTAADDNDRLISAIRGGAQDTINDAGQQIVRRQLNVVPTLTIRPGRSAWSLRARPCPRTLWRMIHGETETRPIADDRPVKLTIELLPCIETSSPMPRSQAGDGVFVWRAAALIAPMVERLRRPIAIARRGGTSGRHCPARG